MQIIPSFLCQPAFRSTDRESRNTHLKHKVIATLSLMRRTHRSALHSSEFHQRPTLLLCLRQNLLKRQQNIRRIYLRKRGDQTSNSHQVLDIEESSETVAVNGELSSLTTTASLFVSAKLGRWRECGVVVVVAVSLLRLHTQKTGRLY